MELGQIESARRTGEELFLNDSAKLSFDIKSFWAWYASDVVSNTTRGALAEFIVGTALDADSVFNGVREEWASYDLYDPRGFPVEVKSSAYIQSWTQNEYSKISFSYPATQSWDAKTNTQSEEKSRMAHVYVFALLKHKNQETLNPLDVSQWEFYVVSTITLDRRKRSQSSITLKSLQDLHGDAIPYAKLKDAVGEAARSHMAMLKSEGHVQPFE